MVVKLENVRKGKLALDALRISVLGELWSSIHISSGFSVSSLLSVVDFRLGSRDGFRTANVAEDARRCKRASGGGLGNEATYEIGSPTSLPGNMLGGSMRQDVNTETLDGGGREGVVTRGGGRPAFPPSPMLHGAKVLFGIKSQYTA